MSDQAERALAEADVILMVVDVTTGVTDEDLAAAKVSGGRAHRCGSWSTRSTMPTGRPAVWEFVSLGLGDPFPVERAARARDG